MIFLIRRVVLLVSLACIAATQPATAQSRALVPGDAVRIAAPVEMRGELLGIYPDELQLRTRSVSQVAVPWSRVTAISVSERRSRVAGALHKGKVGTAVGAVFGLMFIGEPPDEDFGKGELALWTLVESAVFGTLIGAIWPGRRWRKLNVAETRAASRLTASAPPPGAVEAQAVVGATTHETDSIPTGVRPLLDLGAGFTFPTSRYSNFPGLAASLAAGAGNASVGAALVVDAQAALYATGVLGGGRLYVRSRPARCRQKIRRYFGQLVAGKLLAERSGVVEGTGGFAWQPGVGVDFGVGVVSARLQADYRFAPDGAVFDDREPGGPVEKLTGPRVFLGFSIRPCSL